MTKRTNSGIDTLAGAVPGPFGPLTRVTDVDADLEYDDNSDAKVEFTSNVASTQVFMSYNQLNDVRTRDEILQMAHSGNGLNGWMQNVIEGLEAVYLYARSVQSGLFSNAETTKIVKALRCLLPLAASVPNDVTPWQKGKTTRMTQVITGSGASRTATLAITGATPLIVLTDWGDGTITTVDLSSGPNANTYAVDGTYVIKSTAIGPGGVVSVQQSVVVDVP